VLPATFAIFCASAVKASESCLNSWALDQATYAMGFRLAESA
jgi:hypothetical protein